VSGLYPGPQGWKAQGGTPAMQKGVWFDGAFIRGNGLYFPQGFELSNPSGAALLRTPLGNSIQQSTWLGGDMPVNGNAVSGRWGFRIAAEDDYQRFLAAEGRGGAIELWFDMPYSDFWHIPGADEGQTTWKTLRRQPWHIAGVSHATRPPHVFVDGVELTVVTGSPSTGEVQVLDSGGAIGTITTDTDDTDGAEWLEMRYHPVFLVVVSNVARTLQDVNFWQVEADFAEHFEGAYTGPAGE
jgi:hypothetical protein